MLLHLDVNLNVCVSNFLSKNQSPAPVSLSHSKSVFNICSKNTIFDFLFLHKMEHLIHGVSMVVDIVIICKYDIFQKQILNSFFPTPTTSLHNDTVQICLVLNFFFMLLYVGHFFMNTSIQQKFLLEEKDKRT